jgi:hypothetical protein
MSIKTEHHQASEVIANLQQNTFFRRYWDTIGTFLGRGKPVSIWISAAVVMIANLLIGVTISTLLKETQFTSLDAIRMNFMWVAYTYFTIPLFLNMNARLVEFLRLRLVESIQDKQAIHDLLLWSRNWLGPKKTQILFSLGFGIVVALLSFYGIHPLAKFSIGQAFIYFINFFHAAVGMYGLLSIFVFVWKLNKWDLMLYPDDPASSPILIQLSRELRDYILSLASVGAILMFLVGSLAGLSSLIISSTLIIVWIPIIALFIMENNVFTDQITRVKFDRLEKIQAKIVKLSNLEKMDREATVQIMSLMDYHDRVKSTRNSLYNPQAFINLLGSLALPLFDAVLSAIDIWQKIFG